MLIQALRGVAALMVVWHHTTMMQSDRLNRSGGPWLPGAAGVDLFFVISGFVMVLSSDSLSRVARPMGTFLVRRVERVVPMYWLMTTVKIVMLLLLPTTGTRTVIGAWNVASSYLFLPSLNSSGAMHPVLIVGWTLNFEMLFYLIFAVGLGLGVSIHRYLVVMLSGLGLVGWFWHRDLPSVLWTLDPLLVEFLYGALLARVAQVLDATRWWVRGIWIAAAVGAFAVIVRHPEQVALQSRVFVWGLPALTIVGCAVALEGWLGQRVPQWVLEIGDASYSNYLTHTITLALLGSVFVRDHAAPGVGWVAEAVMCLVICTVVAEGVYRGVELPMIRFFKGRRVRATAAPA